MWFSGEVGMLTYESLTTAKWPLIANYLLNLGLLAPILYYKVKQFSTAAVVKRAGFAAQKLHDTPWED